MAETLHSLYFFFFNRQQWVAKVGSKAVGKDSPTQRETARWVQDCNRSHLLASVDPNVNWLINFHSRTSTLDVSSPSSLLKSAMKWQDTCFKWEEPLPSSLMCTMPELCLEGHCAAATSKHEAGSRRGVLTESLSAPCEWLSPYFLPLTGLGWENRVVTVYRCSAKKRSHL